LLPTSHGELLVDSLVSHFAFVEYKFTRDLEERLDDIAAGTAGYLDVVRAAANQLSSELSRLSLQKQPQFSPVTTKAASNGTSAKLADTLARNAKAARYARSRISTVAVDFVRAALLLSMRKSPARNSLKTR
jgi:hypothetical protein